MTFSCVILRWMHLSWSFSWFAFLFSGRSCVFVNYVSYVVFRIFRLLCPKSSNFCELFSNYCMLVIWQSILIRFSKKRPFSLQSALLLSYLCKSEKKKSVLINCQTMENAKRKTRRTLFEYRDDRSRELLQVFNEELGCSSCMVDVLRRVVSHPCSRFWVSEERAFRIVSSMHRRPLPPNFHPLKREMFEEINRRCEQLSLSHPDWPLSRCVYYVVSHGAPKFYLSVASAHALICKERNRCRVAHLLKLRRLLSA